MSNAITMESCSKFRGCDAPICPLDPDWPRRVMIQGENLCHYLCEASKPGASERFLNRHDREILMIAFGLCVEMRQRFRALNRGLDRASKSPSVIPTIQLTLDLD